MGGGGRGTWTFSPIIFVTYIYIIIPKPYYHSPERKDAAASVFLPRRRGAARLSSCRGGSGKGAGVHTEGGEREARARAARRRRSLT